MLAGHDAALQLVWLACWLILQQARHLQLGAGAAGGCRGPGLPTGSAERGGQARHLRACTWPGRCAECAGCLPR